MQSQRKAILACPADMAEMHRLLNNLPILEAASADQLAIEAVQTCSDARPEMLLARHGMRMHR